MTTSSGARENVTNKILVLTKQPLQNSQKQCIQHPSTQGQSSFQHIRRLYKGIGTPKEGIHALSVPQLGSKQTTTISAQA